MAQKRDRTAAAVGVLLSAIAATAIWILIARPVANPPDSAAGMPALAQTADCSAIDCDDKPPLPPIGAPVAGESLHLITHPGRYGLAEAPRGSHYAILSGRLVRVDSDNKLLLSVLRPAGRILD